MGSRRVSQKRVGEARTPYKVKRAPLPARFRKGAGSTSTDWDWIRKHRSKLEVQFAGKWIAVADGRVVGTGVRVTTAMKQAAKQGYDHPLVMAFKSRRYRDAFEVAGWL